LLDAAVASGIPEVILIINPAHTKHFRDYNGKNGKRVPEITFHKRVKQTPGGNGHAIVQAYDLIKEEPFAVRFCDDVLVGNPLALKTLIALYSVHNASTILLERVPKNMVSRFGVVAYKKTKGNKPKLFRGGILCQVTKIIEKPKTKEAPSNLAIVGGYVLTGDVIRNLKMVADTLPVIADDALPLAVALQIQLILKGKVYGWEFPGQRLDCGTLEKLYKSEEVLKGRS